MLLKDKRIFITEDNVFNRSIMELLLEKEGATIAFERWGTDTLERLQKFKPVDIIILDLMFPRGITGFDVYDNIRAYPEFANVPIIAVSAKDPEIALPECKAKGFAGFISKPVNHMIFAQQIAALIEGEAIWYTR